MAVLTPRLAGSVQQVCWRQGLRSFAAYLFYQHASPISPDANTRIQKPGIAGNLGYRQRQERPVVVSPAPYTMGGTGSRF